MPQTLNITELCKKTFKDVQNENTEKERQRMLDMGMEEITESQFLKMLSELDYKIDNNCTFNYYNTGNSIHYLARSMSYIDVKSKQSWAHFEQFYTNRKNQEQLQKIRNNYFVFSNGRIWEL